MDNNRHAYIAECKKCGAIVMAIVENPNDEDEIAKLVGRYLREGYRIKSVDLSVDSAVIRGCACNK
jgi:hypothetical protein